MKETFDDFARSSWVTDLNRRIAENNKLANFGNKEAALLTLFYDERLKARKRLVPKFVMYARACENKSPSQWDIAMSEVNSSVMRLEMVRFLQEKKVDHEVGNMVVDLGVGKELYELTAEGLEELQRLRPPITLRLRAWIAVLPPWLVAAGTIAGGASTIWKATELLFEVFRTVH